MGDTATERACTAGPASGSTPAGRQDTALLAEELACAFLLALMVLLMFAQAVSRNCQPLARTAFGAWLAHASEILPSGLTWLTFLACGAVTRRRELLRVDVFLRRFPQAMRRQLETTAWYLWGVFFAVVLVFGCWATYSQRHQTTSIGWLPQWAVALSVPLGSLLVLWRTAQNLRETKGARGRASSHRPEANLPHTGVG